MTHRIAEAAIDPADRLRAIIAVEVMLRMLRHAVDSFPGDDLETIVVLLTVAAASTSGHLRDPTLLRNLGEEHLPDVLHRPISRRAVAAATGLPRETVRRRVQALVDDGRLVADSRGVRTKTGIFARNRNLQFVRELGRELMIANERLRDRAG